MQGLSHRHTLILLFLSPLLALLGYAQVKIHGKITDANGEPVEFATVRIGGTAIGTTSGLEGDYTLSCPAADTITVHFSCIGYREETRRLIDASGDVTLNMRLQLTTEMLQQVEVTELKKQTGSIATIDASELRKNPDASGGSVESLITTMAGVTGSNEMSSQYSVRGGSYDENSVYINGIEVYRPLLITSGQQEGLSVINPDLVGAIGFSTGGFPAEYGDKMSSVLDITYRQPESFEGSLSASLMGASLSIGQGSKKFSQLHGIRYKRNSSLLSSMDTKGEYDPTFFDYQTNINWQLTPKFKLSLLGNISVNHYKFTPQNRTTTFGTTADAKQFTVYFDGHEKDRFETYFGAISLDYRLSRSTNLQLLGSAYLTDELVAYDISGEYWLDQAGTSNIGGELGVGRYHEHARNRLKASVLSLALKGETAINPRHTLTYGLNIQGENIMDRSREWELRDSAGFSLPSDGVNLRMVYNLASHHDLSSTRFSAFAQDAWKINTAAGFLTLNAGLRLSYWSFNKELLLSPRVTVGFIPEKSPSWAFRFATGLYYQSPFYKEYRVPVSDDKGNQTIELNTDIKSQRSFHIIAGTDYTFRALNRPFKLSGELYYKALSDLVPYEIDNLKIVYSGLNESSGYATGLDLKLFGQFVPGSDSWISFSLMKTSETLHGVKVPRPTDRSYSLGLFFTDYFPKFPKLKFALRGIFMDGLPSTAPRSSRDKSYFRMPPYKRVDIGLSYALLSPLKEGESRYGFARHFKSVWLGVDVFNLLDIANVASYYWVTDVNDIQYAVPNYLTRRQLNLRLTIDF
ncbi:carboxypeptidase-like regulatory domain-containing protein [uncultured Duncaniella sp.]|uniref:TonB-dependent receptor n=1 Tax=uncultured Duncaniella sp. TaxID=2768039 RepID=UPI00262E23A7|nr:carboxypeptidase-like regulatory domain-containing protein [uncultured Duncaniella sp.]